MQRVTDFLLKCAEEKPSAEMIELPVAITN